MCVFCVFVFGTWNFLVYIHNTPTSQGASFSPSFENFSLTLFLSWCDLAWLGWKWGWFWGNLQGFNYLSGPVMNCGSTERDRIFCINRVRINEKPFLDFFTLKCITECRVLLWVALKTPLFRAPRMRSNLVALSRV
ncbi:hypothetical protein V8C40DRAFT_45563 [Trichoderma camerunense]